MEASGPRPEFVPLKAPAAFGSWSRWWSEVSDTVASLVLPWECPVCGHDHCGDGAGSRPGPFCPACRAELLEAASPCCVRCAMPVGPWVRTGPGRRGGCAACRDRRLGFDAALALGPYQGPLRALCLTLKHTPGAWLARWMAELLVEARPELRGQAAATPGAWVVPVPLHWRRRWARGYNQSEELARGLADALGLPTAGVLRRVRHTGILAGLGRVERLETLRGAFAVRRRAVPRLKGRTVFLVDDILTSGATCGAAARALKQAGAARVVAVVIGRAEGRV